MGRRNRSDRSREAETKRRRYDSSQDSRDERRRDRDRDSRERRESTHKRDQKESSRKYKEKPSVDATNDHSRYNANLQDLLGDTSLIGKDPGNRRSYDRDDLRLKRTIKNITGESSRGSEKKAKRSKDQKKNNRDKDADNSSGSDDDELPSRELERIQISAKNAYQ